MSETKDLVAALADDRSTRRKAAWSRYAELIRTATGTRQEVMEMKSLQAELGRSVEDVAEDRNRLRAADEWARRIKYGTGLQDACRDAQARLDEHCEETARILAQRKESQAKLRAVRDDLDNRQNDARDAVMRLEKLREENPELLADPSIP